MKWIVMMLAVALVSGAMIGCEPAEDTTTPTTAPVGEDMGEGIGEDTDLTDPATTVPATQASAALTVANQYCAVMSDHKIDPAVTVAHDGKKIGFCCEDCIPEFKKEPAKYLAAMK